MEGEAREESRRPWRSIQPVRSRLASRSIVPEPHTPRGGASPMVEQVGRAVAASTLTLSMAPVAPRMPLPIPPPSEAGPAEQAQPISRSELPTTSSPFVPMSTSIHSSASLVAEAKATSVHSRPAVMSPPT